MAGWVDLNVSDSTNPNAISGGGGGITINKGVDKKTLLMIVGAVFVLGVLYFKSKKGA